jgi:uncharacterized protein
MNAPASQIESGLEIRASALESDSSDPRITRERIAFFVTVIVGLLLSVNWFVCHTWNHFWGIPSMPRWQIIPSLLTISFVVTTLLGFHQTNSLLRIVYRVSAIWLGVLSFTFFASVVCWFIYVTLIFFGLRAEPRLIVVVLFGLAFFASIYGLVNAAWIRVTRITVTLPHLPEAWRGRSAALVTDLHLGNVRGRPFTRRVVARLRGLQPDAVFISGDMFDGTKADLDWLVAPWSKLSVPRGTYFVTGNHEEFTSRTKFVEAIGRTGIRVLNNKKVDIDGLQIVGVHDGEAGEPQTLRLRRRRAFPCNSPGIHVAGNLGVELGRGAGPWTIQLRTQPIGGVASIYQQRRGDVGYAHAHRHKVGDRIDSIWQVTRFRRSAQRSTKK